MGSSQFVSKSASTLSVKAGFPLITPSFHGGGKDSIGRANAKSFRQLIGSFNRETARILRQPFAQNDKPEKVFDL